MEITSRQRAKLKGIASNYDTIFQIGKNAISDELIKQLSDALEARELIKIRVLENCGYSAKELAVPACRYAAAATRCATRRRMWNWRWTTNTSCPPKT